MKKVFCELSDKPKAIVYCDRYSDTYLDDADIDIMHCLDEFYEGKFNKDEYDYSNNKPIKDDERLYITYDGYNYNVWQIQGSLTDIRNKIIPHVYRLCKIGIIAKRKEI